MRQEHFVQKLLQQVNCRKSRLKTFQHERDNTLDRRWEHCQRNEKISSTFSRISKTRNEFNLSSGRRFLSYRWAKHYCTSSKKMELAQLQCLLTMILHWTALYWPADQWCFWKIIRSHSVPCYDRCIEVSSACVSVIFTNEIRRYAAVQRLRQDMNFKLLVAPSNFLWLFSFLLARTIGNVYRRAISDK